MAVRTEIGSYIGGNRMLLGLVSLALADPLAACAETWSNGGLTDVVESADLNMAKMDGEGFRAARDTLLRRLVCVSEPLSGRTAGAVHRVVATGAFLEKDDTRIAPALAGLLTADPGYQLPLTLYPEGHPIRGLLSHGGLLARDTGTRAFVSLESGWLEVDGLAMPAAPLARAAIVQHLDGQGAVVETRYVWPESDLGDWAARATPAEGKGDKGKVEKVKPEKVKPEKVEKARPVKVEVAAVQDAPARALPKETPSAGKARVPMIAATATSVLATGVLYGLASSSRAAFWDTSVERTDDEIVGLQGTTNGLTVGWVAAGIASVGLGVGLAFAW